MEEKANNFKYIYTYNGQRIILLDRCEVDLIPDGKKYIVDSDYWWTAVKAEPEVIEALSAAGIEGSKAIGDGYDGDDKLERPVRVFKYNIFPSDVYYTLHKMREEEKSWYRDELFVIAQYDDDWNEPQQRELIRIIDAYCEWDEEEDLKMKPDLSLFNLKEKSQRAKIHRIWEMCKTYLEYYSDSERIREDRFVKYTSITRVGELKWKAGFDKY